MYIQCTTEFPFNYCGNMFSKKKYRGNMFSKKKYCGNMHLAKKKKVLW